MPTALITGASTGIGQATALRLAKAGLDRARRRARPGRRRAPAAQEAPDGRVQPLILDVTDFQQIKQAAGRVSELGGGEASPGRLDALVNNAGIGFGGPLELIHPDDLRKQFDVNVLGQIAVTQALLPALRAAHGRIVFLSSVGGAWRWPSPPPTPPPSTRSRRSATRCASSWPAPTCRSRSSSPARSPRRSGTRRARAASS